MENNKQITLSPKKLFDQSEVKAKFESILGKKAPGFIVSVINCINNDKNLQKADQNSILFAAANAAILDLPIDHNLGFAYIIAYFDSKQNKYFAQFQVGYKGLKQLALRTNKFKFINASDVREGEIKDTNYLTGEIIFEWIKDRNQREKTPVIGYVGYFELLNGFSKTLYMTNDELEKHGKKYSQTYKRGFGNWKDDFDSMALKTVTKLNLSKDAPMSIETQRAILTDQAVLNDWDGRDVSYVDNDNSKPDPEAVSAEKERARIKVFILGCKSTQELEDNCKEYCEALSEDDPIKELYLEKLRELKLQE